MTDFRQMYEKQISFMKKELDRKGVDLPTELVSVHHSICSHLQTEITELLDTMPWHFHKETQSATPYALCEEMVDVFKWLMNMMYIHGIQPDQFLQQFYEKSLVVEDRSRTEAFIQRIKSSEEPIAIFDLDGVICDRDSTLGEAALRRTNTVLTWPLQEHFTAQEYEQLKFDFYEAGLFYDCSPHMRFVMLLRNLVNTPILILTARDAKRHPRLHYLTALWLQHNQIPYDGLLFAREKDKALVSWINPLSIFFDDEDINVREVGRICSSYKITDEDLIGTTDTVRTVLNSLTERRKRHATE